MAMSTARINSSPEVQAIWRRMQTRMVLGMQYENLRMVGDYVGALRLRFEHPFLHPPLAGPVGRLP